MQFILNHSHPAQTEVPRDIASENASDTGSKRSTTPDNNSSFAAVFEIPHTSESESIDGAIHALRAQEMTAEKKAAELDKTAQKNKNELENASLDHSESNDVSLVQFGVNPISSNSSEPSGTTTSLSLGKSLMHQIAPAPTIDSDFSFAEKNFLGELAAEKLFRLSIFQNSAGNNGEYVSTNSAQSSIGLVSAQNLANAELQDTSPSLLFDTTRKGKRVVDGFSTQQSLGSANTSVASLDSAASPGIGNSTAHTVSIFSGQMPNSTLQSHDPHSTDLSPPSFQSPLKAGALNLNAGIPVVGAQMPKLSDISFEGQSQIHTLSETETHLPRLDGVTTPSNATHSAVGRADMSHHVSRQIAEALQQMPNRPVEISLSPKELGQVRLAVSATEAGIVVTVMAERSETMDLLRRHINGLESAFQDIGYSNIAFSFSGGEQSGDGKNRDPEDRQTSVLSDHPAEPTEAITRIDMNSGQIAGLDIRL